MLGLLGDWCKYFTQRLKPCTNILLVANPVFEPSCGQEGATFLATGVLRSLSEQQLVDCYAPKGGIGTGCQGGQMVQAYQYVLKNKGIDSEKDYNYTGVDSPCWTKAAERHVETLNDFHTVPKAHEDLSLRSLSFSMGRLRSLLRPTSPASNTTRAVCLTVPAAPSSTTASPLSASPTTRTL